jgi:cytochrome P450
VICSEAGAIILKVAYGYSVEKETPDPLVLLVENMMANFSQAVAPLAWLVDAIPAIQYLPDWLPGMSFKKTALQFREVNQMAAGIPFSFTKEQMALHSNRVSLASKLITTYGDDKDGFKLKAEDEEQMKWALGALYGGGADTIVSSLASFILAMMKFPHVQQRAQQEIDQVIGPDRLPQFEDLEKLPYVDAVAKEAIRWFPVGPLGVAHLTDSDLEYRGYHIPKGTIIVPSVWWFLHDPQVYHDPESFDPTRFLTPRDEPHPENHAFGFGRRICPGRYLAESNLFLSIAQLLATFDIEKDLDKNGIPIEPVAKSVTGLIDHPQPFSYRISPRSPKHEELIRNACLKYGTAVGDSHKLKEKQYIESVLAI